MDVDRRHVRSPATTSSKTGSSEPALEGLE
jgi:hypothetical protein